MGLAYVQRIPRSAWIVVGELCPLLVLLTLLLCFLFAFHSSVHLRIDLQLFRRSRGILRCRTEEQSAKYGGREWKFLPAACYDVATLHFDLEIFVD